MAMTSADEREWRSLTGVERAMARRMAAAADIPLASLDLQADVTHLLGHVQGLRRLYPKITVTTVLVAAVAGALQDQPMLASVIDYDEMRRHVPSEPGIGVAVDSERGLVVPVIRNVASVSSGALVEEVASTLERARSGDRDPELYSGGHFTITNMAQAGVHGGRPIVNVPQVAILGVGTAQERPVVQDGEIRVGRVCELTLSLDHRALDGMTGSRFLVAVAQSLEDPASLFEPET